MVLERNEIVDELTLILNYSCHSSFDFCESSVVNFQIPIKQNWSFSFKPIQLSRPLDGKLCEGRNKEFLALVVLPAAHPGPVVETTFVK